MGLFLKFTIAHFSIGAAKPSYFCNTLCQTFLLLFPMTFFELEAISSNNLTYRKVTSSNTSHLEAHAGFFRLLMKGIFNPYVL